MTDPVTAGLVGTGLSIGSTFLGARGSIQSGQASAAASVYQAQQAEIQAKLAETQAAYRAAEIEKQTRFKADSVTQNALENGLETSGSVTDLQNMTKDTGHLDALTAVYEGQVAATGYRNQETADLVQAQEQKKAGYQTASAKILSGAASIYKNFNFSGARSSNSSAAVTE